MKLPSQATKMLARQLLIAQKHSPHILFGAGVAGVITSTILACRATLKLSDTLDSIQGDVHNIKSLAHSDAADEAMPTTVEYRQRDLAYTYIHGGVTVVKLYAPAVLIGAAAIGALTGSHVVLARRNAALTAAYAAISKAYEEYRNRVRDEVGAEKELKLYHGAHLETVNDGVSGHAVQVVDPNATSPYARFFDEYNQNWVKNAERNHYFVQAQQNYANHLLQSRGHVFLNEVYDMFGFEHSSAGAVVGWVLGNGDNYVDFGLFEARNSEFINGWERSILLDFNVDGVIYDKI